MSRSKDQEATMNKSSAVRLGVVVLALALIIVEREWIRNAAYFLWVHFYWFASKLWQF